MPKRIDVERPGYDRQEGAHDRMMSTGDLHEKLYGADGDRERYEAMPEEFPEPIRLMLYTVGQATVFRGPSHPTISNPTDYHGFKASASELRELGKLGTIVHSEEFRPHVTMSIDSKNALRDVLELPFVYEAQLDRPVLYNNMYAEPANPSATYSLT